MIYKLGSLFDGSGGFPLAGSLCGITPVWASEVEPYPIAVTRSRFPCMKHLGDVSKINGAEIEPVDIITFGSPCQDLSVAGKRAGLKHEDNGDDETTRSGLFMEAIRIIKEMRRATNGRYPTFALWENVPGAFSSNKGEDFRVVLEELIKIVEPRASMPPIDGKGWAYADCYMGDRWSVAYRTFDAQYWGVPQRRRRIHLVADFRGQCAGEILFKREGVRGYFEASGTQGQGAAADVENCVGAAGREVSRLILDDQGGSQINVRTDGKSPTLRAEMHGNVPCVLEQYNEGIGLDIYNLAVTGDVAASLTTATGQGASNTGPSVCIKQHLYQPMSLKEENWAESEAKNAIRAGESKSSHVIVGAQIYRQGGFADYVEGEVGTLRAAGGDLGGGTENLIVEKPDVRYIVRRLTPTECARLQGFPDKWGHPEHKDELTDEEWTFWADVRNTHAAINGKAVKSYTKEQMLAWYNKLHTDSAEYKMWGNGIALPPALYCMQGIAEALEGRADD